MLHDSLSRPRKVALESPCPGVLYRDPVSHVCPCILGRLLDPVARHTVPVLERVEAGLKLVVAHEAQAAKLPEKSMHPCMAAASRRSVPMVSAKDEKCAVME